MQPAANKQGSAVGAGAILVAKYIVFIYSKAPVTISLGTYSHTPSSAQSIIHKLIPLILLTCNDRGWALPPVSRAELTEPRQQPQLGVHPATAIIWNKFNRIKFWLNAINMIDLVTYPPHDSLFNLFFHSEKGCCIDPKHYLWLPP